MAAKRKRSLRGLGGSPVHHNSLAKSMLKTAEADYVLAYQAAATNCVSALNHQSSGDFYFGKAVANAQESGSKNESAMSGLIDTLDHMGKMNQKRISKLCFAPGKGMNGLGRQPSRRRR